MPQDANSIPLDDEDILDLTMVVEPGNHTDAIQQDGPPEPGDSDIGFDADLDALLDSLSADGSVTVPAASKAPATAQQPTFEEPVAAPIASQTPVDHIVDPHEELALPETTDIDSLLAELGAEMPKSAPDPAVHSAPMPEFDGILAQAQAAETQKAAEEAAATVKHPAPDLLDDLDAMFAQTSAPAPEIPPVPEAVAAPVPEMGMEAVADENDSLDLNELDALLDDILSTAPEMAPASPPADPVPQENPIPVEEPVFAADSNPAEDVIPVPDQALMPSPDTEAMAARLQQIEETLENITAAPKEEPLPEIMLSSLIEAKLAAATTAESSFMASVNATIETKIADALAPGSPFMETIVATVLARLTESGTEQSDAFAASLEKMAAAAAAKVIREEIATLMAEE